MSLQLKVNALYDAPNFYIRYQEQEKYLVKGTPAPLVENFSPDDFEDIETNIYFVTKLRREPSGHNVNNVIVLETKDRGAFAITGRLFRGLFGEREFSAESLINLIKNPPKPKRSREFDEAAGDAHKSRMAESNRTRMIGDIPPEYGHMSPMAAANRVILEKKGPPRRLPTRALG
ncbi:MAG: hypothetical protein AAGB32_02840 [Pseudomonadota bacterium]